MIRKTTLIVFLTLVPVIISIGVTSQLLAQNISNLTLPSEEELREALNDGEITREEFQILLEYFYESATFDLSSAAGNIPNLDLIGPGAIGLLDKLQQEQLNSIGEAGTMIKLRTMTKRSKTKDSRIGAWSRVYVDKELNGLERSRQVYKFRVGASAGWSIEGSVGSAYGQDALWRSRAVSWKKAKGAPLALVIGNYDVRWGTGLAFGRRARLLSRQNDLSFESLRTPDRGGFNGLSFAGETALSKNHTLAWRALGSSQRDMTHRLNTIGLMGATSLAISSEALKIGALWGRSVLSLRDGSGEFVQEQYSLSISGAKTSKLWFNAEVNTQSNEGALTTAVNAEWRYRTDGGNVRGGFWRYPRSYRNLTGGARSGILYETIDFDNLGFSYRDRRVNQAGGLFRSITALDENNKIETGIELSSQDRGGDTRGDYILAYHHRFDKQDLKLEAGGRTVTKSSDSAQSRWRLRAQVTSHTKRFKIRAALRYLKEVSRSPALGLFARISRELKTGSRIELWLDVSRFRWWQGGLERFYGYAQFATPLDKNGSVELLTKIVYRYNELSRKSSRVVARFEMRAHW